nr:uncharacterized protein LOC126529728 [Dermacentor andersoni]
MALNLQAPAKGPRVSEAQKETVVAFMEAHPQLAIRSSELGPRFTAGDRRRLWQQLADQLNTQGPVVKTTEQGQEWWRKQVFEARRNAAALAQEQRSTGGGRLHGFHGRVLELTGTVRLHGVTDLPYQEQADVPTCAMEVVVQDEAAGVSTATRKHQRNECFNYRQLCVQFVNINVFTLQRQRIHRAARRLPKGWLLHLVSY